LRRFANTGSDEKSIGIWNLRRAQHIPVGKLKTQAYRDYFYGKNLTIEKALGGVESRFASVSEDIIATRTLPSQYAADHHVIIAFIFLLYARTIYSEARVNEIADHLVQSLVAKNFGEDKKGLVNVKINDAVLHSMKYFAKSMPVVYDLDFCLVINNSPRGFITSDNPVVLYNQFLEARRPETNNIGLVSLGLQIFFPLSPGTYLIFYDKNIYGIGNRNQRIVTLSDSADIFALNQLQYVNCSNELFANENIDKIYLERLAEDTVNDRRNSIMSFEEYPDSHYPSRSLVKYQENEVRVRLNLSFIRILRKAQKLQLPNLLSIVRSPQVALLAEALEK
jgi:hypothetical protein